jgi:DUF971 family protein
MASSSIVPREIGRSGKHDVLVRWRDDRETVFPARFLRLACPCASCIEEMTGRKILKESDVPEDIHPLAIQPVGQYAIKVQWSDGHASGIFTWERLDELSRTLPMNF